mmetsp:Transcript_36120/g.93152  ORF Transcript_36120/g.93152 Transcript_36120/m.93152 type:complete len:253 (+) Transcript_36120:791-1549(+)
MTLRSRGVKDLLGFAGTAVLRTRRARATPSSPPSSSAMNWICDPRRSFADWSLLTTTSSTRTRLLPTVRRKGVAPPHEISQPTHETLCRHQESTSSGSGHCAWQRRPSCATRPPSASHTGASSTMRACLGKEDTSTPPRTKETSNATSAPAGHSRDSLSPGTLPGAHGRAAHSRGVTGAAVIGAARAPQGLGCDGDREGSRSGCTAAASASSDCEGSRPGCAAAASANGDLEGSHPDCAAVASACGDREGSH